MADDPFAQYGGAAVDSSSPATAGADDPFAKYGGAAASEPSAPAGTPGGVLPSAGSVPVPAGLQGPPAPTKAPDWRDTLLQSADADTSGNHPVKNFVTGVGQGAASVILHPLDAVAGMAHSLPAVGAGGYPGTAPTGNQAIDEANQKYVVGDESPSMEGARQGLTDFANSPAHAIGSLVGQAGITAGIAKNLVGPVVSGAIPEAASALRDAAIGDQDVAAMRGLQVPSGSPKALGTLKAVAGARPYLQGVQSLEDLQARIPLAKGEIWRPYQQTINAIGDTPVKGPDGMTTVSNLEGERLQISAMLRDLKSRNPEAIQLAQQKGLTQASLLDRERAIKSSMDPVLQQAGINPVEIRARFADVAKVGQRVSGKTTLGEKPQPYGVGKMLNLNVTHPLQAIPNVLSGARDIVAGRPLMSGSPTDIGIREAFRNAPPKSNLGEYTPTAPQAPAPPSLQLGRGALITPPPAEEQVPSVQPAASVVVREPSTGRMTKQFLTSTAPEGARATIPQPADIARPSDVPQAPPRVLNGQIVPPEGYSPQTHTFSSSAWKAANPKGNIGAARAIAVKQGYEVAD